MGDELQSENDVMMHLSNKMPRPGRICPLLNQEDNTFHLGMSTGMGGFEALPVERFGHVISNTIKNLYAAGRLIQKGEPRTIHPDSPLFIILEYLAEKPE